MAVDGPANTVVEVDSEHVAARPGQPDRQRVADRAQRARDARARPSGSIDPLQRPLLADRERDKLSALGDPTGYKLMPGENVAPMYAPDADYAGARGLHERAPVGHEVRRRRSASARATTPTSTRAATASRARGVGPADGGEDSSLVRVRRPPRRRGRRTGR